ncbi:MAG TPA: NF038129 family PEP-CTERM protein [Candidatus Limnocylindrales bacterium]|nr:NF038129 family PEP-CTERM protein [Candidatus Limnocylindrales bacterium]
MKRIIVLLGFAACTLLWIPAPANADSFSVTLDTSSLSGTQELAFLLTDGDGVVDNTSSLSVFAFGGGAALGAPDYLGTTGVTGDLASAIAIDDSSGATAIFTQQFTPGSSLSFLLDITDNFAGGTPDTFAMEICDSTFSTCYSDDVNTGAMLVLNMTAGPLSASSFILNGASQQNLPAPVVTALGVESPEPASLPLLVLGLLWLARMKARRPSGAVSP